MDERDLAKIRLANTFAALLEAAKGAGLDEQLAAPALDAFGADATPRTLRAARHVEADADGSLAAFLTNAQRLLQPILTASQLRIMRRDLSQYLLAAARAGEVAAEPVAPTKHFLPPDLKAWAIERGIPAALDAKLPELHEEARGDWPSLRYRLHHLSIAEFLRSPEPKWAPHQEAVFRWLERFADARREALEEERTSAFATRPLPEDAPAALLVERLRVVRAALRELVEPQRRADMVVVDTHLTDENPPSFVYEHVPTGSPRWVSVGRKVTVPVTLDPNIELRPICAACNGVCTHQLAAIDHLLGVVFQEEGTLSRSALLDAATTPTWERWMNELDAAIGALDASPLEAQVWWRLESDALAVTPYVQSRGKRGAFLAPKKIGVERLLETVLLERRDETIALRAQLLKHRVQRNKLREAEDLYGQLAQSLVDHPRVTASDDLAQWKVVEAPLALTAEEVPGGVAVRAAVGDLVFAPDTWREHADHYRVGRGPLVEFDHDERCVRVTPIGRRLDAFLERWIQHEVPIPAAAQPALMSRLSQVAQHVPVKASDVIQHVTFDAATDVVFVITPLPADKGLIIEVRIRPLKHGPLVVPGAGADEVTTSTPDRHIVQTTRERHAELVAANAIVEELFDETIAKDGFTLHIDDVDRALDLVDRIRRDERIEVVWPERAWRAPKVAASSALVVRVNGRKDWFDVDGAVRIDDDRVELAVLLDAVRHEQRYVRLDDGQFVRLEQSLYEHLVALEPHVTPTKRGSSAVLELSFGAAEIVDALGRDAEAYEAPELWSTLLDRIARANALEPEPPPNLAPILRPYQREGHAWLSRLAAWGAGGVLADDMGLGKTLQAIAVLQDREDGGPALVVAPTSVGFNWTRELERFAPTLSPKVYAGGDRERLLDTLGPRDVVITSYGIVQRDAEQLARVTFHTVVLDEAQAIKNPAAKRSRAVRALRSDWTIALTGTPIENHPGELWALFAAVFPGLLGSWERFRRRFLEVHADDQRRVAIASAALSRVVKPFILRRTKAEVAKDLPPRSDITIDVVLSHRERALYDDARLAAVASLEKQKQDARGNQFHVKVLAMLTRLRQLSCHPRLVDDDSAVPSAKLDRLLTIVRELGAEGRRALVFSQFTTHLALVREALDEEGIDYAYLDGATPMKARAAAVDRFQESDVPLFLISVKAGGTGLNLTAADTVVHLDPWWNPAVEDQATDRAHRIGQTQPVTVYRLVARDTVEEKILELHDDKRQMVAEILEGSGSNAKLSTDELAALIREA